MKKISLIAAIGQNSVIGNDNKMPWHLPADLKFFKQTTMGKSILMGRKTWDSIGKPLPGRKNIVISRNNAFNPDGATIADNLQDAITAADSEEVMIIGGATIYQQSMPLADHLYITRINHHFEGDAFFPKIDPLSWKDGYFYPHKADKNNPYDYDFIRYDRI